MGYREMSKRTFAAVIGASLALSLQSGAALAQAYPAKPIRMVVPYDPGGISDIALRLVQPTMEAVLGQTILVENRPGAGGLVGTEAVARMPADGYTLLGNFDSFAAVPFLYANVHHDPVRDFAPISLMARGPQVLVVDPALGIAKLDDFLQLARRKEVAFSTAGPGSSSRLSMELLKVATKIDVTLVSYPGGAPAVNAVLGGHVAGMMASMGVIISQVKAGKLTALGVSSAGTRAPLLPGVPPISDSVPKFDAQSWVGVVVPAGTPRPIVERLNEAVVKALHAPEVTKRIESMGMEVVASTPDVYGEWIRAEVGKWRPLIQQLKIQLE